MFKSSVLIISLTLLQTLTQENKADFFTVSDHMNIFQRFDVTNVVNPVTSVSSNVYCI